ncbi:MAG: hypothetical protein CMJ86_01490 [Planctomycetes bacterium]|nr:hypothetical protein [Planctomycetota bacterium]
MNLPDSHKPAPEAPQDGDPSTDAPLQASIIEGTEQEAEGVTDDAPIGPPAKLNKHWGWLVLVILGWFAWTGSRGLDFGRYWDDPLHQRNLQHALDHGRLLPGWYNYPSMTFLLSVGALAPELSEIPWGEMKIRHERRVGQEIQGITIPTQDLKDRVGSPRFVQRQRKIFLGLASLALLWIFLAGREAMNTLGGLWAATALGTSWEFAYHARWVAPDPILVQFASLFLWLLLRARRNGGSLVPAAMALGAVISTKYTGGILLLPLLVSAWNRRGTRPKDEIPVLLLAMTATFIAITPGCLVEPQLFLRDVLWEVEHYGLGAYGYTVAPGLSHMGLIIHYLGRTLGSAHAPLAAMFSLLVFSGMVVWARRKPNEMILLAAVPCLLALLFSSQRVFFARNMLLFLPFGVLFAAQGALWLGRWARYPMVLPLCLVTALAIPGALRQEASASSIEDHRPPIEAFADWINSHEKQVGLTPELAGELESHLGELPDHCVTGFSPPTELIAFRPAQVARNQNVELLGSNLPGSTEHIFGPLDVNWEWYTTFHPSRIVVARPEILTQFTNWEAFFK